MAGGNNSVMRGSRIGGNSPSNEDGRFVEPADRIRVDFFCSKGHDFHVVFAAEADMPEAWECPTCGSLSSTTPDGEIPMNLTVKPVTASGKTHWEQLIGRRTEAELEALLKRALSNYRRTGRAFTAGED